MQNKVELVGYYGSDESIALAAWTSTNRELDDKKRARIPQMVKGLWTDGHKTPFERGIVHFLVTSDIASHIHMIKHRIAGTNGESARYKEIKEDKIYIPEDWPEEWQEKLQTYTEAGMQFYHEALEELTPLLGRQRAKESARYFRGYNTQIDTDIIMNMSCFANFLYLRTKDRAQQEIREIGKEMARLVNSIEGEPFKATMEAFGFPNVAKALGI